MFSNIFKKRKARIFLGQLAIAPKDEWEKTAGSGIFKSYNLEHELNESLRKIFAFTPLSKRKEELDNDLGIDVFIVNYSGGEMDGAAILEIVVPVFWRPRIELKSRIYNIKSNKTLSILHVKVKMDWGTYNTRAFSFKGFFRIGPLFSKEEMNQLLYKASYELLLKAKKSVGT